MVATEVTGVFSLALLISGMLPFGVGSVFFLPISCGALSFVFGLLIALLYNLVARFVGGAEVEVEPRNVVWRLRDRGERGRNVRIVLCRTFARSRIRDR